MPMDKSPGPDGYSVEFMRSSWDTVGSDVVPAIKEFFRNGRLLKDLNTTTITLIPKTPEACKLSDYRPISCCNIVYKVLSKIIANRLKPVLQTCISPNQAAFLKGRSLGENVLLSSELIKDYNKASCVKSCMLKVDIRKAFDTVCWDFVLKIMEAQEFPPIFRVWIKECITSPRFSVAINGELAGFFPGKKGLRQGDSISPYLFIMVMEALSQMLESAAGQGKISLHPKCSNPMITHLLFADDLLVFSDGSNHSLSNITAVMTEFKGMCGLDMNPSKSEIFFGGYTANEAAALSNFSGFKLGSFPTRYLGLPLNPQRISISTMQPFIERITSKLHSWTVKFLSFAGKITLISSVIYGMVNFWSSVFSLPKRFYAKIDSLCSAFLWKNKTGSTVGARVAWRDVCRPKQEGGLGIRLLEDFETVFRLKQIWILFSSAGSLWVAWTKVYIFGRKGFWLTEDASRFSRPIRSMLQLKPLLVDFLRCDLGNGVNASFWYDCWTDMGLLIYFLGQSGPRQLRIPIGASVSRAVVDGQWHLPGARSDEAQTLQIYLTNIEPPNHSRGSDSYRWRNAAGLFVNTFSSKGTWEHLRVPSPIVPWHGIVWFKEAVPRCSFITWLAMLSRLPTKDRLRRWGLNVQAECVFCLVGIETHEHLFFDCPFSTEVWSRFSIGSVNRPQKLLDMVSWIGSGQFQARSPHGIVIRLLVQTITYMIWKERNSRIFTNASASSSSIRHAVDRQLRDRLLSFSATNTSSPSLLELYFSCVSLPL